MRIVWTLLVPVIALVLGFALFYAFRVSVPADYTRYVAIAILAGLDSVFGGIVAAMQHRFDSTIFASGFFTNAALAALLAYAGDQLGVDLFLAAVVALGIRIFGNLGIIRQALVVRAVEHRHPPQTQVEGSLSSMKAEG